MLLAQTSNKNNLNAAITAAPSVCVVTDVAAPVAKVSLQIENPATGIPVYIAPSKTKQSGCGTLLSTPPTNYVVAPFRYDEPLNGVSTWDLVLLSQAIQGVMPLGSPYKIIAADVNWDGVITTQDVVALRKLVLKIEGGVPGYRSWRFVDASYVFPNPANPFMLGFPQTKLVSLLGSVGTADFVGIKMGDLNNTANPHFGASDDRTAFEIFTNDQILKRGTVTEVPVYASELQQWLGFQLALQLDKSAVSLEKIIPGSLNEMGAQNFIQSENGMRCSWANSVAQAVIPELPLFTLQLKALETVQLSNVLQLDVADLSAESYDAKSSQRLNLTFRNDQTTGKGDFALSVCVLPNPSNSAVKMNLELAKAQTVTLELYDVNGILCQQQRQFMEAGKTSLEIPSEAMAHPGIYIWHLLADKVTQSGKIVRQ
jgi:hypothetical protein